MARRGSPPATSSMPPKRFQSPNTRWAFDLDKAAQLLEQAGWTRGSDGIRLKGGRRMQVLFQTSKNLGLQKTQAIVKQALERIGIEVELKAIPGDVFGATDPGNPDTVRHFYADMQLDVHFVNTLPVATTSRHSRVGGNPGGKRCGDWMPAAACPRVSGGGHDVLLA